MSSDMTSNPSGGDSPRSGQFLGTAWSISVQGTEAMITIGDAQVRAVYDGYGYVSHEVVGRWQDPSQIAYILIHYHPDYSPLANQSPDDVNT
jgi:hypothetical protein